VQLGQSYVQPLDINSLGIMAYMSGTAFTLIELLYYFMLTILLRLMLSTKGVVHGLNEVRDVSLHFNQVFGYSFEKKHCFKARLKSILRILLYVYISSFLSQPLRSEILRLQHQFLPNSSNWRYINNVVTLVDGIH